MSTSVLPPQADRAAQTNPTPVKQTQSVRRIVAPPLEESPLSFKGRKPSNPSRRPTKIDARSTCAGAPHPLDERGCGILRHERIGFRRRSGNLTELAQRQDPRRTAFFGENTSRKAASVIIEQRERLSGCAGVETLLGSAQELELFSHARRGRLRRWARG
jgi:hypothetical protein